MVLKRDESVRMVLKRDGYALDVYSSGNKRILNGDASPKHIFVVMDRRDTPAPDFWRKNGDHDSIRYSTRIVKTLSEATVYEVTPSWQRNVQDFFSLDERR